MTSGHASGADDGPTPNTGLLESVPLLAIDRQNGPLQKQFRLAIDEVCESGRFVLGPDVAALENELAAALDVPHVIGCASGSDALLLALMALG
ncbi:MAG: hypothetical protein RLZZ622_1850, partial [Planctomycetota bacterium]